MKLHAFTYYDKQRMMSFEAKSISVRVVKNPDNGKYEYCIEQRSYKENGILDCKTDNIPFDKVEYLYMEDEEEE